MTKQYKNSNAHIMRITVNNINERQKARGDYILKPEGNLRWLYYERKVIR